MVDKDRIEGAGKKIKGSVKEGIGKATRDEKLKTEGKVQNTVGGLKDKVRDAVD